MPFRLLYIFIIFAALKCGEGVWAQEEGFASYYHSRFHGKKSSNGEVHDRDELVAAHRTYPFGTFLRVTNLSNMKSTIVCVTDRGPRRKGRIIDVSASAAEILGFIAKGVTRVRVEEVPGPLDLSYPDMLYPMIPFLNVDDLRLKPPYRVKFIK